jgi:Squalene-hopene cyclase C-terminal domain
MIWIFVEFRGRRVKIRKMRFPLAVITTWLCASSVYATPPESVRGAVSKILTLMQKSAAEYTVHRKCFSCHHQAIPVLAFTTAQARGFDIDVKELQRQLKFTADFLGKNRDDYLKGKGQGGQADTAGYALVTLDAGGWKADDTTAAVVEYLLQRNKDRDHWLPVSQRPPTEASPFTTTYVALHALMKYTTDDKQKALKARVDAARKWLAKTDAKDTEERVFRLRALKLVDAEAEMVESAVKDLAKTQRGDGGWSQTDKLDSDAYATGTALAALHQAGGLATADDAYQRGIKFLLKTQLDDGSWHIKSRSKPFQSYFETGFPHEKDQFISSAATAWATIALTLTIDKK